MLLREFHPQATQKSRLQPRCSRRVASGRRGPEPPRLRMPTRNRVQPLRAILPLGTQEPALPAALVKLPVPPLSRRLGKKPTRLRLLLLHIVATRPGQPGEPGYGPTRVPMHNQKLGYRAKHRKLRQSPSGAKKATPRRHLVQSAVTQKPTSMHPRPLPRMLGARAHTPLRHNTPPCPRPRSRAVNCGRFHMDATSCANLGMFPATPATMLLPTAPV